MDQMDYGAVLSFWADTKGKYKGLSLKDANLARRNIIFWTELKHN